MSTYFRAEVCGATLAADPPCAVHENLFVAEQLQVLVHVVREVAEFTDVRGKTLGELPLGGVKSQFVDKNGNLTFVLSDNDEIKSARTSLRLGGIRHFAQGHLNEVFMKKKTLIILCLILHISTQVVPCGQ